MNSSKKANYFLPFVLVTSLFFLWGLANSLNGTLIRHFQTALDLSRAQAGVVDSAFYIGYFTMALPAGFFMKRYGYKKGILLGLLLYAGGALLFLPATDWRIYGVFLLALFIIASGLAFLETAANLYMTVLGDSKDAALRLNIAQMFNGLSIILGPAVGSWLIFSKEDHSREQLAAMPFAQSEAIRVAEAQSVQTPYLYIALLVLFITTLFWFTKMPEVGAEKETENDTDSAGSSSFSALFKQRHLVLGIVAQFLNVGAQASIWGYFVDFKNEWAKGENVGIVQSLYSITDGMTPNQMAGFHASAAMILFMIGRFVGTPLMLIMKPNRVLALFAAGASLMLIAAATSSGITAVLCLMSVYFFHSIVFPTIFALATDGIGKQVKLASSLVIMSIVGGAVLAPLTGLLFKSGTTTALMVPLFAFLFILFYALVGYKKQEIVQ
jgi:MFS transporter, FHS family, L-fucose permease